MTNVYGDTFDDNFMSGFDIGRGDVVEWSDPSLTIYGDAAIMAGQSLGGNDLILGAFSPVPTGGVAFLRAFGDAELMEGRATGGNDRIDLAGRFASSDILVAFGDALEMTGAARGGDDVITAGGTYAATILTGDAQIMSGQAQGGDDTIVVWWFGAAPEGTTGFAEIRGDAGQMSDRARGGNDLLDASALLGSTRMVGDAVRMFDKASGGNDTLIGGAGEDAMWGDGVFMDAKATGGADLFVFHAFEVEAQVTDTIGDFRQQDGDVIDVSAFSLGNLSDLGISDDGTDTTIQIDALHAVRLTGFADATILTEADFHFG